MTKIDIFSGFLGAGKTTLIKKLIAEAYTGEKLVLIENEFGEIGIDGGFLQDAGLEITEMNSGCICCSLVGDFSQALKKVLDEFHPDRILIEPSGVGKLSDVIRAVQTVDSDEIRLNTFTTIADATKCKMYMKNFGEFFNNQIEHASCIILSRTENISEKKLDECLHLILEHNQEAAIITTPWDQLGGKMILETMERKNTLEAELLHLAEETEHSHHHDHSHEHEHDHPHDHSHEHKHDHPHDHSHEHKHDHHHGEECTCGCHDHEHEHHHADEVFTSWGIETAHKYTKEEIEEILDALDESKYGMVLRSKGILADKNGNWIHFDYVPGESNVRYGSAAVTGRLCVIGSKLDEHALAHLFHVE